MSAIIHEPISTPWPGSGSIPIYIPDNGYRKRDERYADQYVHTAKPDPLWNKTRHARNSKCFSSTDFHLTDDHSHCIYPAGETRTRQVSFLQGKRNARENHIEQMKAKIDSKTGKEIITRRFATMGPVFGNLRGNKRLHRLTLRGKAKVDGQWKLYCMMDNIENVGESW